VWHEQHYAGNPTDSEANKNRIRKPLPSETDKCGDAIIQCRLGGDANISEFGERELAMCWLTDARRTGRWNALKKKCLTAGMRLHQERDAGGVFVFDPSIPMQARLAIKSLQAKAKRRMPAEALAMLAKVGF
jgi:hypothetical protein